MNTNNTTLMATPQQILETNTITSDKWVLIAPLGDHPHAQGIQRVDAESLRRLVRSFHSLLGWIKRACVGRPIYYGHPDAPEFATSRSDNKVYGVINELASRPSGLYARITLTDSGAQLVNAGVRWLSPYWKAEILETVDESGRHIVRPVELLSLGLTTSPNIPGQSLTNSRATNKCCVAGLPTMKRSPLTANLREHYFCSLSALQGSEEIRAFINERCDKGCTYDDAFRPLFHQKF